MNIYSTALFLHIVGALGLSLALGLEWTGLWQLRGAVHPEEIRAWMGILKNTNRVGFPSMLTAVITGFYMLFVVWGWVPWITVTLGSLVIVIVLSAALTRPRMMAVGRALAAKNGPGTQTFTDLVNHPILWISIQTRLAVVLGIVFLKIVKPDLAGSLLTIGVAIVFGIGSALPISLRVPAGEASVD